MIEVRQLTKSYGSLTAIQGLEFQIGAGEVVGFLGPNGAGKSTTMRILAGAMGTTTGSAHIGGHDVFDDPRAVKSIVGYLPERPPLYVDMTVRAYVRYCARLKRTPNPQQAADRAIDQVGVNDVAHRVIGNLSKGYRQRVGIAQAIVHSPKVLILDEPVSGLDPAQRIEVRNLVRSLAATGTTILLSTHVLQEVEAVCGRMIVIDKGLIRLDSPIDAVQSTAVEVRVQVARPDALLESSLFALDAVTNVTADGENRFQLSCTSDIREAIATHLVPYGLLEMTASASLEHHYLSLLKESA